MSARSLAIVGAGGFGREVAFAAERCRVPWRVIGFYDDRTSVAVTAEGWRVLGSTRSLPDGQECVVAVGSPRTRRRLVMSLSRFCVCFVTVDVIELRHASVAIGTGSMLMAGARTTVSTSIGSHFIANLNCTLGHDAAIGDFVTVAPLVAISGGVRIGNGVEIGTGACLREGIQVGDGALIGMGAVVVKDVPANAVVVGNPARQIRSLEPW